jgi:hypothetical protein
MEGPTRSPFVRADIPETEQQFLIETTNHDRSVFPICIGRLEHRSQVVGWPLVILSLHSLHIANGNPYSLSHPTARSDPHLHRQ